MTLLTNIGLQFQQLTLFDRVDFWRRPLVRPLETMRIVTLSALANRSWVERHCEVRRKVLAYNAECLTYSMMPDTKAQMVGFGVEPRRNLGAPSSDWPRFALAQFRQYLLLPLVIFRFAFSELKASRHIAAGLG